MLWQVLEAFLAGENVPLEDFIAVANRYQVSIGKVAEKQSIKKLAILYRDEKEGRRKHSILDAKHI